MGHFGPIAQKFCHWCWLILRIGAGETDWTARAFGSDPCHCRRVGGYDHSKPAGNRSRPHLSRIEAAVVGLHRLRLVRNGFPAGLDPFPYEPFAALIQKQLGTHIYSLDTNVYSKYPNEAATVLHGLRLARNGFQTILNTLPCELIVTMVQT